MRIIFPLLVLATAIYAYSCANPGSPSGGPKDTIPPTLLESKPNHKTINYQSKSFQFSFDERISADQVKQRLVITPFTENPYKFRVKKTELFIDFEESFEDSTTYTFNFADGVVDVTEKNPVVNFSIAFSTGPYIDSISVSGKVKALYTNEKQKEVTVALYAVSDTLDTFSGKPRYFTKTDTSGYYLIENIKNDFYYIFAFEDKNNNLTTDSDEEPHGFLKDSINLHVNQDSVNLNIQLLDVEDFKFIRSKNTGQYFDILYSKYIKSYQLEKLDVNNSLPIPAHNLIKENTTIRYYYDSAYTYELDSIGLMVQSSDSVYNTRTDTIFVKFSESKRKAETMVTALIPKDNSTILPDFDITFRFTKPINQFNPDSITFQYDTLFINNIPDTLFTWNDNHTELSIQNELSSTILKSYVDSLLLVMQDTITNPTDTLAIDSVKLSQVSYLKKIVTDQVYYKFRKGTFVSVDQDSVEELTRIYKFKNSENFGTVSGNIVTDELHYILQLVNKSYQVITQLDNPVDFKFNYVKPGQYSFRILIDHNNDGIWTHGNIKQNIEPEPIYFYPEKFDIRSNWEIENIEITF